MARTSDVSEALATLQARWGSAAPRRGGELGLMVDGALARAPMPLDDPDDLDPGDALPLPGSSRCPPRRRRPRPAPRSPTRTPRAGSSPPGSRPSTPSSGRAGCRGPPPSRCAGTPRRARPPSRSGWPRRPRSTGAIVAWLDLARAFDPVEAVARGIRPEWLVVLTPVDLEEALALLGRAPRGPDRGPPRRRPARRPRPGGQRARASGTGWAGSRRWRGGRGRCSSWSSRTRSAGGWRPRSRRRAACGWSCSGRAGSGWAGTWSASAAR